MSKSTIDVLERTAATFAFTFLSVFSLADLSTWQEASIAGGAAAITVVKSTLVNFLNK